MNSAQSTVSVFQCPFSRVFNFQHSRTRNVLSEELYPCDRKRMSKACTVRAGACLQSWSTSRDSWRMHACCTRRRAAVVRAPPHLLSKCILCSCIPSTLPSTYKFWDHTKMIYVDIQLALNSNDCWKKRGETLTLDVKISSISKEFLD